MPDHPVRGEPPPHARRMHRGRPVPRRRPRTRRSGAHRHLRTRRGGRGCRPKLVDRHVRRPGPAPRAARPAPGPRHLHRQRQPHRLKRHIGRNDMFALRLLRLAPVAAAVVAALASASLATGATTKCTAQQGQDYIDAARYDRAIREFSCVIDAEPTAVEGYRGRIEAELLFGRYSDALGDYARVTAFVLPVHPDARETIRSAYADRLAAAPNDVPALTGASFERWSNFDYVPAIHLLNR